MNEIEIIKIEGIGPEATPLMSDTPPGLRIECQTRHNGAGSIRLTRETALELSKTLLDWLCRDPVTGKLSNVARENIIRSHC
jgi:hypothetical protein